MRIPQNETQKPATDLLEGNHVSRRKFLLLAATVAAGGLTCACTNVRQPDDSQTGSLIKVRDGLSVARFPEKEELIMLTDRPPQLETPLFYYRQDLTANEAFFVRWHFSGIPTSVDLRTFRLDVGGHVQKPLSLTVDELRQQFEPVSLVAVNQCSGNSRSYFTPQVPGGQWGHGAVGNARWTGVRLKDILQKAGLKPQSMQVTFAGLDEPPLYSMHKFVKALDIDHANSDEVLVAYEMNGEALPLLNGFPLRLVVPGWYATYWVKSLAKIDVLRGKFDGFWMEKAYRIPKNANASEMPENLAKDTVPINKMNVRSILVRPDLSDVVRAGKQFEIEGIAFDGGSGIARVEVSLDGGSSWNVAKLDNADYGKFSFKRWRMAWTPASPGSYKIMTRATAGDGKVQGLQYWNKSGYMRNGIEQVEVPVV
ncbi:MAG: molybdopterin-dependent oxidoreductase [Candidatus Obscuribacterales bacterium]|nr:molybdopterin-dependent oxidoreductase [Candidatus Obscuribacterales bacterium]